MDLTNEEFEDMLEAHMRAELGLMPKLPSGHHYFVAHPGAPVEVRRDPVCSCFVAQHRCPVHGLSKYRGQEIEG